MERLEQLIGKLKEQFEKNAPASQLLVITKQIEAELGRAGSQRPAAIGTAKVAVVMPSPVQSAFVPEEHAGYVPEALKEPVVEYKTQPQPKQPPPQQPAWSFDPIADTPTLAQQPNSRELNDVIGSGKESLNDTLKKNVQDFAAVLKDSPFRDLKKAIGINDRFVFINELFRGDEAMYERSIKTINNFRILQEAEYWMVRELKVKLAWDDERETTRHFYQLVKRRFS
jgi:hypothetical protein